MISRLSIRGKTIFGVAMIEAVALCVLVIGMVGIVGQTNTERFEEQANSTASLLARSVANAAVVYDLAEIESLVKEALTDEHIVYARVFDKNAQLLYEQGISVTDGTQLTDLFETSAPITLSNISFGEVHIGIDLQEVKAATSLATIFGIGLGVLELIVVAAFSYLLGSWLTRRLRILMNAASQIASGNLKQPIPSAGNDEIAQVSLAMELMRENLLKHQQASDEHQAVLEETVQNRTEKLENMNTVLKEKARTESEMFATIGHEIRTPLAIASMALKESPDAERWEVVKSNISHALDIANNMNVISRLDKGQELLGFESGNPCLLLSNIAESSEVLAESLGMSLQFQLTCNTTQPVSIPIISIRQVVYNLVKNASIHSGGTHVMLDVSVNPSSQDKAEISLAISDNGSGLSELESKQVFGRFNRGSSKADGMGIGLAVSKDIAERLNGTLIYSDTQQFESGACFTLTVEVAYVERDALVTEPLASNGIINRSILFAEDNPSIRLLTRKILEKSGAVVDCAEDGSIAFDMLKQKHYDLVITDIMMPNMDGYAFVQAARKSGFKGPIIGVTAATLGNEFNKLKELGASDVVSKPINIDAINSAYDQAVRNVS